MHQRATATSPFIDGILASLPEKISNGQQAHLDEFIKLYYQQTPESDLSIATPDDFAGAAISHWQLLKKRPAGKALVHVFNPRVEQHGWQSSHTVIEIVTDDMPHLVNSISMVVTAHDANIHLTIHPVLQVARNPEGTLLKICPKQGDSGEQDHTAPNAVLKESVIHLQIDRLVDENRLQALQDGIEAVIFQITSVFRDREALLQQAPQMAGQIADQGSHSELDKTCIDLLQWLDSTQFHAFGSASFTIDQTTGAYTLLPETALGLMRGNERFPGLDPQAILGGHKTPQQTTHKSSSGNPEATPSPLTISKSSLRSPLNRPEPLDVITSHTSDGRHLHCVLGLFTQNMNTRETNYIPLLREKTQSVMEVAGADESTHDGKSLKDTLESLPRDLLFQANQTEILEIARGIVDLQERQRIKLFGSLSSGGLYYNCLVYIPRDNYGREIRVRIQNILLSELGGQDSEFTVRFSSQRTLARLHFVIHLANTASDSPDWQEIEQRIIQASISWDDRLHDALLAKYDEDEANRLFGEYSDAFPSNYKEDYSAQIARSDISFIETRVKDDLPVMSFYRHILADVGTVNFKLFSPLEHIALSDVIPVIENMGLKVDAEHPFLVQRKQAAPVWIHEFTAQHIDGQDIDPEASSERMQQAFAEIWTGRVENDAFNRLMLACELDWRQVVVLRSYCKYLLQIQSPFSQEYIVASLVSNSKITRQLVNLFENRFNPAQRDSDASSRQTQSESIDKNIEELLSEVDSLDEDRILRSYLNLIKSTLRTNHYCVDAAGQRLPYVSFKLDSQAIAQLPLPRPNVEIFVYSAQVEGIHLRGGKVARGGLRWSDRREDFRTEVLGLMKAQMVKNAVIVPVGSKGGFYVKRPPESGNRDEVLQQGIECYKTFLRGLLDLTDNLTGDKITPPKDVVCYDDDDPYLVVAADKGTATFSDYANEIAAEYGFWLGDAFASGGSVGYDHKKMGITARGAWESVKRHFRELGSDIQQEPFTAVGIGDMAGDVFGNGMLLSEQTRLVAAFNHQHIFIDPEPDAASSFAERQRLFQLPRSSWEDYDTSLISRGGAVFSRSAKKIDLSDEACLALGIENQSMTPTQLINAILKSPVDLLWNGGIGTYIKSSKENHLDAHDRANDVLRVDANELRCRVIGEGGNLGCTQRGRIEFAAGGGKMYTDAIDNSAGVDCSDHEVNIKILVNSIVASGDLTLKHRDQLLAEMTDEVAQLVLQDNYLQTQCISHTHSEADALLDEHARFIASLEEAELLNRDIEFLPSKDEIAERLATDGGLHSPEIAVLVSYSKMTLYNQLLDSPFPDDPYLCTRLIDYFPDRLGERYADQIANHRLHREIIATLATNDLVNRLGPTYLFRLEEELGSSEAEVASAFIAVCDIFDLQKMWSSIEALDNKISADVQSTMHILVRGLAERAIHWILRSRRQSQTIKQLVEHFKPGISELVNSMPECLASVNRTTLDGRTDYFVNAGSPTEVASKVAQVVPLSGALDIVEISKSLDTDVDAAAAVYFELGVFLDLQWLRDEISQLDVRTHWHKLAKSELRSDLHYQQRYLCAEVIANTDDNADPANRIKSWSLKKETAARKYSELVNELKASSSVDFAMLSLAVNEVHKLLSSDRPIG